MPPQLEKNHVVPTSWQDEALARDGVSMKVPCSALKGETVPDRLPATTKSPLMSELRELVMDREAWRAAKFMGSQSQTQLSD